MMIWVGIYTIALINDLLRFGFDFGLIGRMGWAGGFFLPDLL